jgi:NADH-quinone oxidoreductase subunit F
MPAQPEEIEAAEREGVEIRTSVAQWTRSSARTARSSDPLSRAAGDGRHGRHARRSRRSRAASSIDASTVPRRRGRGAGPSILPEGAGIEVSGWAGIVADPRTFATGRAGVFAGGDVVSGPKTIIDAVAAGRRAASSIHEYLAGVTDGEAEILAAVRYPTPPESHLTVDLAVRPRAHAPLPVVAAGFAATQVGFDTATARAEAARCFRCDAVDGCPSVTVLEGRGPADRPIPPRPRRPAHLTQPS